MTRRNIVLNPIAPAAAAGALALGLTVAASPAAVAGPLGEWFGLLAAPEIRSAETAEGTVAPLPAAEADDESSAALRERLAAAERRVAELETELEETRAQATWLAEELEASWRWIEELNAVLADERPVADREPVETAAAPEEEEPTAGAEQAPAETVTAAPEAADDGGRPGGDSGGIAARLARALDGRGRPGDGDGDGDGDGGGVAARLARTLDALGSRRPQPAAPDTGDLRTTGPQDVEDGPPAAAAQQQASDAPYYAAVQAVNLRAEPTTSARVLAVVAADDTVRLLERDRGWFRVRYTTPSSREVTGWVYGDFLRAVEPAEALAVLAPPA